MIKSVFKFIGKTVLSLGMLCVILYVFMNYIIYLV